MYFFISIFQGPSVSLSLSILELHSDARRSARVALDLCEDLSRYLQPSRESLRNDEVDFLLVIRCACCDA